MSKPRKPRAARVATASNPQVLPPEVEAQVFGSPEEGQRAFEDALRNLVATHEAARVAGTLFSPVTSRLVQAVKYQVQFLEIGSIRRARQGAQDAEQVDPRDAGFTL